MEPKKKFFFSKVYHLLFKEKFNKKLVFNFPEKVSRLDLIKRARAFVYLLLAFQIVYVLDKFLIQ